MADEHGTEADGGSPANTHDRLTRVLATAIATEIPYLATRLATIEAAAHQVCIEFQDEGVIPAEARSQLENGRRRLEEAARLAGTLVGDIRIDDEPDDAFLRTLLAQMRAEPK